MYTKLFKRILDIVFSILALPFFFIILIILSPIIFLSDKGPIFYNGSRLGKDGQVFRMYKFRSMKVNALDIRNKDGSTFSGKSDSRLTKIGRFMRKFSIDELPQIFNVLKGEMSIVGPRPNMATLPYNQLNEIQKKRITVRPGITGYSQSYFRNSISQDQKFIYDCYYVDNLSFWMDVKIIFKTILSVISSKNINQFSTSKENLANINDLNNHMNSNNINANICNEKKTSFSNKYLDKRILILGASSLQLPAILKSKELGLYVAVVDRDSDAIGVSYADEFFNVSTVDEVGIYQIAKQFKPNGIMTLATDMPMRSLAYSTNRLGLVGITYDTAIKATDKGEMIKVFKEKNIAHPWYYIISSNKDLDKIRKKITYPCISKPVDSSGSRGVILIKESDDLDKAIQYSLEHSTCKTTIIEQYLQGSEVSVELISFKQKQYVIQVTDKITSGAPFFVEMGHSQPSLLSQEQILEIKELACRAVQALKIDNGPAHVEIIMTLNGPKLVEVGARLGGDYITSHLVPLSTGVDMVRASIDICLGEEPDLTPKLEKGSAIRFIPSQRGKIIDICELKEIEEIEGIKKVIISKKIGDLIEEVKNSSDRIGYVISQSGSAAEAIKICEVAIENINIRVD